MLDDLRWVVYLLICIQILYMTFLYKTLPRWEIFDVRWFLDWLQINLDFSFRFCTWYSSIKPFLDEDFWCLMIFRWATNLLTFYSHILYMTLLYKTLLKWGFFYVRWSLDGLQIYSHFALRFCTWHSSIKPFLDEDFYVRWSLDGLQIYSHSAFRFCTWHSSIKPYTLHSFWVANFSLFVCSSMHIVYLLCWSFFLLTVKPTLTKKTLNLIPRSKLIFGLVPSA
jgi:hypothetical protein